MINRYSFTLFVLAGLAATAVGLKVSNSNNTTPSVHTFTDPGTGCHYLVSSTGVMTPRLHSDGIQVCELSEEGWPLDQNHQDYDEIMPPAEEAEPTAIRVANPTQARILL